MKKAFPWLFQMMACFSLFAQTDDYAIVFIHLGPEFPHFLETSIAQARLFNNECPIYLVANQSAISSKAFSFKNQRLTIVPCETLQKSVEHELYLRDTPCDKGSFWQVTSERFLYLDDLIQTFQLAHVFHLENDVMLYVDLEELLPIFQKNYQGIATTFDHDARCVPGFMYIARPEISKLLAYCFAMESPHGHNDMGLIPLCRKKGYPSALEQLPIIPDTYGSTHTLVASMGYGTSHPELYYNHFDEFQSIFDAATIGQYFCSNSIFINESCIFNPSFFSYEWITDAKGRKIPYAILQEKKIRINNLHIHCKELQRFKS